MAKDSPFILETKNRRGERVIFDRAKWKEKCRVHPELRKPSFMKKVKEAIEDPDQMWEDGNSKERRCYYKACSGAKYVKVIVFIPNVTLEVVTAFETNYIKEKKYKRLKQLV